MAATRGGGREGHGPDDPRRGLVARAAVGRGRRRSGTITEVSSRSFAADAREWFQVGEIEPGLHVVAEPGHVLSWLIAGSERCALLDTGLGLADISTAISPVAAAPAFVVNSHVHFDHVGGNELFEHTEMHELAPQWIEAGCREAHLRAYRELADSMNESWSRFERADRDGWFMIGPDETMRAWPGRGIAELGWRIDPPRPTRLLADGDAIELGERTLRVIHTPGHAPDHICLLDEAAGILFAQDQAYHGPHLIYEEGSDPAVFARSARRLADELAGRSGSSTWPTACGRRSRRASSASSRTRRRRWPAARRRSRRCGACSESGCAAQTSATSRS
ncbi:MAG: MBL fold metallo-hydrolase [Solirubrobacterales bacterium]|nr:MBL fold metallo-hydrolase [Solirubrobacterales bacterium]